MNSIALFLRLMGEHGMAEEVESEHNRLEAFADGLDKDCLDAQFKAGEESRDAEVETLRQQLADMAKDRDRLLDVMGEIAGSKSLTATPTQFYQHLQRIASDATMTQSTRS